MPFFSAMHALDGKLGVAIDQCKLTSLDSAQIAKIEGAPLLTATQINVDVLKNN